MRLGLAGLALVAISAPAGARQSPDPPRLRLLTSARQMGPVGYRDPIGAVSPDGRRLAFTSGGRLEVADTEGGPRSQLGELVQRIYYLTWLPDSRHIAVLERRVESGPLVWSRYDVVEGGRQPLWDGAQSVPGILRGGTVPRSVTVRLADLRDLAWSPDGSQVAGILPRAEGSELWILTATASSAVGETSASRLSFPAWTPDGAMVGCLARDEGPPRLTLPCGGRGLPGSGWEAYGPISFAPDGRAVYFAHPNDRGTVDLWLRPLDGSAGTRLTSFARDTYAPSVTRTGRVVFALQDYRTFVAAVPAEGGRVRQITRFQSETPNWSRDGALIGFTYGSWRRLADDINYPDIAQHLGVVRARAVEAAAEPEAIVRASRSEDQGLDWSPDGRWIVLHSHADGSDDLWIQPANGSAVAQRVVSGGRETGWPRWSPDGRWIAYGSDRREGEAWIGTPFLLEVDLATGRPRGPQRRVMLDGYPGVVDQVEWFGGSDSLAFDAFEGLDLRAIYVVSREGGRPRLVHRFRSEHRTSGLGVAPTGEWIAFIAPGGDGNFQLFRVAAGGGVPVQLTFDPTDKTQPSVSPDGREVAFTVFHFSTQFWTLEP